VAVVVCLVVLMILEVSENKPGMLYENYVLMIASRILFFVGHMAQTQIQTKNRTLPLPSLTSTNTIDY
jgi:hypothetical protein